MSEADGSDGFQGWDEQEARAVLASLSEVVDGDEPVDELSHALQCAGQALAAGVSGELVAAALLHDVGRAPAVRSQYPGLPHEIAGARWLAERTSAKVAWLVEAHVPAKVYLVQTDPEYAGVLSPESVASLRKQRGHHRDLDELARHPWWPEALDLRRWDDKAKVPGGPAPSVDEVLGALKVAFSGS